MSNSVDHVRLIARREIATRVRSPAFLITTAITVLLVVAVALVTGLVRSDSPPRVAVLSGQQATLAPDLTTAPGRVTVRTVPDAAAGATLVAGGDVDAFIATDRTRLRVLVHETLSTDLRGTLAAVAARRALDSQVQALGGDPAAVSAAVSAAGLQVQAQQPPPSYDPARLLLGVAAGVLIFLALQTAGQSVATGVVEEKTSRVVELLLATVRPWQLMTGKVLGLGALGLLQVAVVGIAGVLAGYLGGSLHLPAGTAFGLVGWLAVWFVLGYLAYAFVFAALGALVSRQEDIGGVVTPVLLLVVIGYVVGVSVLPNDPGNRLVAVMSMVPAFAPTLMPIRLAIGNVPGWQTALSLLLLVAVIPGLSWVSARIYRNAVVRSGARVRVRDALRQA